MHKYVFIHLLPYSFLSHIHIVSSSFPVISDTDFGTISLSRLYNIRLCICLLPGLTVARYPSIIELIFFRSIFSISDGAQGGKSILTSVLFSAPSAVDESGIIHGRDCPVPLPSPFSSAPKSYPCPSLSGTSSSFFIILTAFLKLQSAGAKTTALFFPGASLFARAKHCSSHGTERI